jgi:hypothetical protein
MSPGRGRIRPRLSRTLSRGRWREYGPLLAAARERGYHLVPLESWVRGEGPEGPALILRHDVDQHPASALRMAAIEAELGVRSAWYFRWRTAHPQVIGRLRDQGFEVGLHYETLTRAALRGELPGCAQGDELVRAREELREEIAAFARLFGPIRSVVPHGDSRVPGVRNAELLRGERCSDYGIEFDGNEAMRGRGIAHWLTDRSSAEGGWAGEVDPLSLLVGGATPILSVTHPNNWASGLSLWRDRALSRLLPGPSWAGGGLARRPIHTGSDLPPP